MDIFRKPKLKKATKFKSTKLLVYPVPLAQLLGNIYILQSNPTIQTKITAILVLLIRHFIYLYRHKKKNQNKKQLKHTSRRTETTRRKKNHRSQLFHNRQSRSQPLTLSRKNQSNKKNNPNNPNRPKFPKLVRKKFKNRLMKNLRLN